MGKLLTFLCVVLFTVSATASGRTEVNNNGEVRVVTDDSEVWRNITEQEAAAIARPGEEIPTDLRLSGNERDGFFHIIPVSQYTKVVVFADNRIQVLEKTGEVRGERKFAVYVTFCLISVLLMLISNTVMWRARKDSVAAAVAAVAVAAAAVAAAAVAVAVVAVAVAVVAAVAAAAVAADTSNKKLYLACAVIYYVAMAVALFI